MLLSELTKRLKLTDDKETERMLIAFVQDQDAYSDAVCRVNKMRAYNRRLTADGEMVERHYKPGKGKDEMLAVPDEFDLKVD